MTSRNIKPRVNLDKVYTAPYSLYPIPRQSVVDLHGDLGTLGELFDPFPFQRFDPFPLRIKIHNFLNLGNWTVLSAINQSSELVFLEFFVCLRVLTTCNRVSTGKSGMGTKFGISWPSRAEEASRQNQSKSQPSMSERSRISASTDLGTSSAWRHEADEGNGVKKCNYRRLTSTSIPYHSPKRSIFGRNGE
jgi:hypothetical protein